MSEVSLWTIGHGLASVETVIRILRTAGIDAVADVRTVPYSNRAPQFDKEALELVLRRDGIRYRHFGAELGGRPLEDKYYDDQGYVLYRRLAQSPRFQLGMDVLMRGALQRRTAVLCSESHPASCHRNLLVGRAARLRGANVEHL